MLTRQFLSTIRYSFYLIFLSFLFLPQLFAGEGMWMPNDLKRKEAVMKEMGLQLPVEKIFNKEGTALNRAVLLFGSGCTGEVISNQGLVLTNHHCGYGTVQGLSGIGKDYFANGFWAMNNGEELPCPGLSVTFIKDLVEVTPSITTGIEHNVPESKRDSIIAIRIKNLEKGYRETGEQNVSIKPFFQGNQYWAIISEVFTDIRLVGFPPNGIGSFGGDTDNWMWPRHTGDFSLFRIYANSKNEPAAYSTNNKPYQPKQYLTINAGGIKEEDFTMVYGFPGTTMEYISSYQLDQIYSTLDPIRIETRTKKLDVWNKHMSADRKVFLQYTSKKAGVANGWKKWQGEVRGLRINNVVSKKREQEQIFQQRAFKDTAAYNDNLLSTIQANTQLVHDVVRANEYYNEAIMGIEIIALANNITNRLNQLKQTKDEAATQKLEKQLNDYLNGFYKNYNAATDQELFSVLMPLYKTNNENFWPAYAQLEWNKNNKNFAQWAAALFQSSALSNQGNLQAKLNDVNALMNDPVMRLTQNFIEMRKVKITQPLAAYNNKMKTLNRNYMQAQTELMTDKEFYPDANLTLRLTFGKVKGIDPDGPAPYSYQTFLSEAVSKNNPEIEEFKMPAKLIDLYQKKDFGRWKQGNDVPIAFIAQNHTTGGNSGSPVLNAKGELIGTNFDRIWEGTMSDLYYDPKLCRNISVDIRYTLFIIEKFGGAGWLLKEMKIVK